MAQTNSSPIKEVEEQNDMVQKVKNYFA